MGYLPWYCEGTREGRPLRACLILLASFHSIARGAKKDRISSQLRVIFTSVSTLQYLPHSPLQTLSGITGLLQYNIWICLHREKQVDWLEWTLALPASYYEYLFVTNIRGNLLLFWKWHNKFLPFWGTGFLMLQQYWPSSQHNSGLLSKDKKTSTKSSYVTAVWNKQDSWLLLLWQLNLSHHFEC